MLVGIVVAWEPPSVSVSTPRRGNAYAHVGGMRPHVGPANAGGWAWCLPRRRPRGGDPRPRQERRAPGRGHSTPGVQQCAERQAEPTPPVPFHNPLGHNARDE